MLAVVAIGGSANEIEQLLAISIDTTVVGVQSAAERIVELFAARTGELLGLAVVPPGVEIRNTPNLAYFDHRSGRIVLAHWPTLGSASKAFFIDLAGTEEEGGALFVSLFNEFLVAHEMGHWVQRGFGIVRDRYGREQEANDIAVAFFRSIEGGEPRLNELRPRLESALARLSDPTPADLDERAFFNAQYAKLAVNPAAYGYYQFRFILNSIESGDRLEFAMLLRQMAAE